MKTKAIRSNSRKVQKKVPTMRRKTELRQKTNEKLLPPEELKALYVKRQQKLEQKRIFIEKIIKRLRNASRSGHVEHINKIFNQMRIKDHINAGTSQGLTALHWAAARGHYDIVKLLVENGANPTLLTARGKTAADLTRFRDVKKLLLEEEDRWVDTHGRAKPIFNPHSKPDPLDAYDEYISGLEKQIIDNDTRKGKIRMDPRLRKSTNLLALTRPTNLPGLK
ncbi:Oidioi.mRNA.OKI2018_I69.PAR.g11865.t1.cds [Oikopleura dioica]|uniref:Oidioi.mRNA.OKI2018_I69.PAR.g11865.t1.cds n=1 Tax=Oikopleura dioica TaxID=34765 RepID=A0ABN7S147_OIKDI|nr:Oidioi.mRNA.OKI2018_I69.PAR.g11865.t1.cds [Oikopleura dioica]